MKKYLFYAASALAVVGCSNDDYLGNNDGNNGQNGNTAISFAGGTGKLTRNTTNSGEVYEMLDGQFKVYGIKSVATAGQDFQDVFKDYSVWYVDGNDNHTTSNSKGWEYVGANGASSLGTGKISLSKDQTIKYWDYSAAVYRFVAASPIDKVTFKTANDTKEIQTAEIEEFKGHITPYNVTEGEGTTTTTYAEPPVYIATPQIVNKENYKKPVTLTFVRQHAMVRVGIYETIPGYNISSISFYGYEAATEGSAESTDLKVPTTNNNNITLTSATSDYFIGGTGKGEVTYNWTTTDGGPTATLKVTGENLTKSKNWYAGQFKNGVQATSATEAYIAKLYGTDKEMDSKNGYFAVLPTQETTASPLIIKCDYTLTSEDGSGETIKVTGATAAIPAAFSKWKSNTLYTYLFKISDNTNGGTGEDTDPKGLYPITFDAVVTDNLIGTTTTFSTPSITTYQENSVNNNSITYKAGAINFYVYDETKEKKDLSTSGENENIAVYKLTQKRTEADLQVTEIWTAETTNNATNKQTVTVSDNVGSFTAATPSNTSDYYAIQYKSTDDGKTIYTYKVVEVVAAASTND